MEVHRTHIVIETLQVPLDNFKLGKASTILYKDCSKSSTSHGGTQIERYWKIKYNRVRNVGPQHADEYTCTKGQLDDLGDLKSPTCTGKAE